MTSLARFRRTLIGAAAAAAAAGAPLAAHAQLVINDTLTGASSSYDWKALNGACLTAGDNTGTIPACVGLSYYSGKTLVGGTGGRLPDAVGHGALRLTNGDTTTGSNGDNQTGAVVSNFTFPTNEGIQVTWTSVTYGGDNLNNTGADGISFFLADGAKDPTVGALGGSLGYSCSNKNGTYDGVEGGYLGVGIDEYGNFSNPGDNTDSGPGYHPGRISVRGYGDTNFADLNASTTYGKYYPSSLSSALRASAIHNTCSSGYIWDYSKAYIKNGTLYGASKTGYKLSYNYRLLKNADGSQAYVDVPTSDPISNQEAMNQPVRGNAKPITYSLKITSDGILDFSYSYNGGANVPVISGLSITDTNGPLPSSFRFGFSSGTGGGNNVHEITCFKAAPANDSNSSAGSNVQQSARVETGSQVYLAYYHPSNWWGQLTAQSLVYNASTDTVSISSTPSWDAHCVLTGGDCSSTGVKGMTAEGSSSRAMVTWDGTQGVPLQWGNLTSAQQAALTNGDASATSTRLSFLRGDRTNEVSNGGTYRNRSSVLGAIVDSSPTWVGAPSSPYAGLTQDKLHSTATVSEGSSYAKFAKDNATRTDVVYVGADDGLLHGFRSGSFDSTGNFVSTYNDGREVLAYMPAQVVNAIHSTTVTLDYSATQYSHNFYVDATPGSGDLYYNNAWHTWLVGGLGPGGQAGGTINGGTAAGTGALYALDVTTPSNFSEANAASLVMGEWNSSTLTCTSTPTACGSSLGLVYGTPVIRRLHDGKWGVIFGNGLNSTNGTGGIFIMEVDPSDGSKTFRYLDTGYGPSKDPTKGNNKNGIVQVTPVDLDGDYIADYVYAGDAFGNVWRFDLTDTDPSKWAVRAAPIFSTDAGQPITTRVAVGATPTPGTANNKVLLAFGTGQKQPQTLTSGEVYATGTQALYGVWDADMSGWNTMSGTKYDTLTTASTVTSASLTTQTVTGTQANADNSNSTYYRTVSNNTVCWQGSTACSSGNNKMGWLLDLPGTDEQVIYNPVIAYDMFIVNTMIPASSQPITCENTPASGYTMAIQMATGGAQVHPFFEGGPSLVGGIGESGTGTPSFVIGGEKPWLVQQTHDGKGSTTQVDPTGGTGGRLNWTKLR